MQIQINSGHVKPTDAIIEHINQKLEQKLKRFMDQLTRVEVHLRDENGPKGGRDKQCLLEARLAGFQPLAVDETAEDMYLAIDSAAEKLQRAIEHKLERHKEHLSNQ